MLSNASVKLIRSLQQKKYRDKHKLFVVEGKKSVNEFLEGDFALKFLIGTDLVEDDFSGLKIVSDKALQTMSNLKNHQQVLAVFEQAKNSPPQQLDSLSLALDGVRDPGNLGTLIRLADWYGIENILCSTDTVEQYNPKVIQASMGSLTRVKLHYVDLEKQLQNYDGHIYGTFMDGENIYQLSLEKTGIIILGNEGKGISPEIEKLCTQRISIPQFGNIKGTESLNVAIAGAIVTSAFFAQD